MWVIKMIFQMVVRAFFKIYFSFFGHPKINPSMRKTLELYETGDFSQLFQLIRSWDAPYEAIDKLLPKKGTIVDLGCGDGLLANYIGISRTKTEVLGIDINKDRVKDALRGIRNVKFVAGDILKKEIPRADLILIVHVLHHLPSREDQEKVLIDCKNKLKQNGKLVIAEVSERPLLKYLFTWLTDTFTVPILFENRIYNPKVFFRKDEEWRKLFTKLGLKYKVMRASAGKPFSHIIFECSKIQTR